MRLTLIVFSLLTSLSICFATQEPAPVTCGKPIPIRMLPRPEPIVTYTTMPLRFGGTRVPPYWQFPSDKGFREVIKDREQLADFWKRYTSVVQPGGWVPPLPQMDFSKEMIIVAAMGWRPSPGFVVVVDGACELDGQLQVFVTNVDDGPCTATLGITTSPADVVVLPRTDLPIVFKETRVACSDWVNRMTRLKERQ